MIARKRFALSGLAVSFCGSPGTAVPGQESNTAEHRATEQQQHHANTAYYIQKRIQNQINPRAVGPLWVDGCGFPCPDPLSHIEKQYHWLTWHAPSH